MVAGRDAPVFRQLGHAQRDASCRPAVAVLQIDRHLGVVVLAAHAKGPSPTGGARIGRVTAEQFLEEGAVVRRARVGIRIAAAAELEAGVPVRRRAKVLPGLPVWAELIVGGALLRVLEHLVGLADLLEPILGIFTPCYGVQLVDEQDDLALLLGQIVEHRLEALFVHAHGCRPLITGAPRSTE